MTVSIIFVIGFALGFLRLAYLAGQWNQINKKALDSRDKDE